MALIDGDKIVTVQLYDDEHEEFTEKKMSIIEIINAYTTEGVTVADDVLGKIRAEIEDAAKKFNMRPEISYDTAYSDGLYGALSIIDKCREPQEGEGK